MNCIRSYFILMPILLLNGSNYASVILLADVPKSLKELIEKTQKKVTCYINDQCQQTYLFEKATHEPHITLTTITAEKLKLTGIESKDPLLVKDLAQLTNSTLPIDMSKQLQELDLEIFSPTRIRKYQGNTYHNYAILVIKINPTPRLTQFIKNLDETLEQHPIAQKRKLPFVPHITIGWIYEMNDQGVHEIINKLRPLIEKCISNYGMHKYFTIDAIIMADENTQKILPLKHMPKTSSAIQPQRSHRASRREPLEFLHHLKEGIQPRNACPR